jgi:hypothetical protein
MSRITPLAREIAARIIAHEAEMNAPSASPLPSAFQACERLRPHLSTLMGRSGFRALLSRALAVTSAEAPGLQAVTVKEDGSLEGWDRSEPQADATEFDESSVLLIAQLLSLLVAFIGDNLMLHLVRDVWPALSRAAQSRGWL